MGQLLGFGAPKIPAMPAAPKAPDTAKVVQQSDLDRQRQAAAGASPSTTIAGASSALTQTPDVLKKTLQGF